MQIPPQLRLFGKRQCLQGPGLGAVRNADRAVDVNAAEHDNALGHAAEKVHQRFRLRSRTDDEIDHYIGSKAPDLRAAGGQLVAVAENFLRAGCGGRGASVENSDHVALPD